VREVSCHEVFEGFHESQFRSGRGIYWDCAGRDGLRKGGLEGTPLFDDPTLKQSAQHHLAQRTITWRVGTAHVAVLLNQTRVYQGGLQRLFMIRHQLGGGVSPMSRIRAPQAGQPGICRTKSQSS